MYLYKIIDCVINFKSLYIDEYWTKSKNLSLELKYDRLCKC